MKRMVIMAEYYNRLRGRDMFVSVWAVELQAAQGLAIHHMLGRNDIPISRHRITHIASGKLVGKVDGYTPWTKPLVRLRV